MCWQNGWCGAMSTGPSNSYHHEVEHHVAKLWDYIAQPLLFGIIGASVDFRELDMSVIPKALLVVVVGMCVRVPVAFLVTAGKDLSFKERAFIGLSWIPKATVQAALGSVPLDLIREKMNEDDPDFDKWNRWGEEVLVTAVVSILLTAPIGLICISKLGPMWLKYTDLPSGKGTNRQGQVSVSRSESQEALTGPIVFEPENWALMEEARRASPEVLNALARTHTSRFFSKIAEESAAIRKLLNAKTNETKASPNEASLRSSSLLSPAPDYSGKDKSKRRGSDTSEDGHEVVSIRLHDVDDGGEMAKKSTMEKIREHLDVLDEGVEAVWRVIDEQGENFPTADLFITSGGNYQNIPTVQEISR
ncbi:SLC9B2, partial [Symbiodinium microadriaticum]